MQAQNKGKKAMTKKETNHIPKMDKVEKKKPAEKKKPVEKKKPTEKKKPVEKTNVTTTTKKVVKDIPKMDRVEKKKPAEKTNVTTTKKVQYKKKITNNPVGNKITKPPSSSSPVTTTHSNTSSPVTTTRSKPNVLYCTSDRKIKIDTTDTETMKKIFNELFRYIYECYQLDHSMMKKKYEKNIGSKIMDFDDVDHEDTDSKWEENRCRDFCSGDQDDIPYVYKKTGEPLEPKDYRYLGNLNKFLSMNTTEKNGDMTNTKKIIFDGLHKLNLININGSNSDSRGVRSLDWHMEFHENYLIENPEGINLDQIIIGLFKIKSHKFENWYELYSSIKSMRIENGTLLVYVMFDHGS